MWEPSSVTRKPRDFHVLILVCVEVSVGEDTREVEKISQALVLILVCVEVSVGVQPIKDNIFTLSAS